MEVGPSQLAPYCDDAVTDADLAASARLVKGTTQTHDFCVITFKTPGGCA